MWIPYSILISVQLFFRQEALLSDEQAQEIVAMLSPHNGVSLNDSYQSVLSYERYTKILFHSLTTNSK